MQFRKDINGLRALAVLSVLLYHFEISGFKGGFSGVDIFFVISGFLIGGIVLTQLDTRSFSILSFYAARLRRIVPALLAVCITLMSFGWFWLPPIDYAMLGKHTLSSLLFLSNFQFEGEAGYFDSFSKDKWLLHTWSLSLEWQFYLILPVGLYFLKRMCSNRATLLILSFSALASFALSVYLSPLHSAFSFFILPTRVWEFLAGTLVFLAINNLQRPKKSTATKLQLLSIILFIVSIFGFDENTIWPGYNALIPVLATGLFIYAQQPENIFTSHKFTQLVGLWSYSIYLWHWPVLVGLRLINTQITPTLAAIGISCSVLLGFLSYRLIETPCRKNTSRVVKTLAIAIFSIALMQGYAIHRYEGFPNRAPLEVQKIENTVKDAKQMRLETCSKDRLEKAYEGCKTQNPNYVLLGDSHAGAAFAGLHRAANARYGIAFIKSCPVLETGYIGSKRSPKACPDFITSAIKTINNLPRDIPLVIISRFSYYISGYNEHPNKKVDLKYLDVPDNETNKAPSEVFISKTVDTMCQLSATGRSVYVLKPIPEIGIDVPLVLTRQLMLGRSITDIYIEFPDYIKRHRIAIQALERAEKECGIKLLDPTPYLCEDAVCYGSHNGVPYYYDDDHLNITGAEKLAPLFKKVFSVE